jgi:hypothetical protein
MKIIWALAGYYERITEAEHKPPNTLLKTLMGNVRAISTEQKCYHLGRVHQNFGMKFLPETTFIHLMHQALGHSPQLATNILAPSISSLEITPWDFTPVRYRFVTQGLSDNFHLDLEPDDPQTLSTDSERWEGYYRLQLSVPLPGVDHGLIGGRIAQERQVAEQQIAILIDHDPLQVLHAALSNTNTEEFALSPSQNITCWLQPKDLPSHLQSALSVLKEQRITAELAALDEVVKTLVLTYRQTYIGATHPSHEIPELRVSDDLENKLEVLIGKGLHRDNLTQLIEQAEKYLLICSYRLEDIEIITRIAQKATQIPVWILTDFSDEVQDRVDLNMVGQSSIHPGYENSDIKKKECLQMLVQTGVGFRSGSFHLKTYISEKMAYLGSCNLTGGSLARNGEAGLLWSYGSYHQELIDYFRYLWESKTNAEANPSPTGLRIEGIRPQYRSSSPSIRFLESHTFNQDLQRELQELTKTPQEEIRIYTRSFNPTYQQLSLLKHLNYQVYYSSYNQTSLKASSIPNLHAKIILLGRQVAYIGSQDFNFGRGGLAELTYKTKNRDEIEAIYQNIRNLH